MVNQSLTYEANVSVVIPVINSEFLRMIPLYLLINICIIVLNMIVLWGFYNSKKTFSNCLFLSIALSDLLAGLLILPLTTISIVFFAWPLGSVMCYVKFLLAGTNFMISDMGLLFLTTHRFLQMIRPFSETEQLSKKKVALMTCPWILAYGFNIFSIIGHLFSKKFNFYFCQLATSPIFQFAQTLFFYCLPLTITIILNLISLFFLCKRKKPQPAASNPRGIVLSKLSQSASRRIVVTSQIPSRRYLRDKKALICIFLLIANVLITQYFALVLTFYTILSSAFIGWMVHSYVVLVELFPMINPLTVLIFHETFRKDLRNSFRNINSISKNSSAL